jgi:hypothetical protein
MRGSVCGAACDGERATARAEGQGAGRVLASCRRRAGSSEPQPQPRGATHAKASVYQPSVPGCTLVSSPCSECTMSEALTCGPSGEQGRRAAQWRARGTPAAGGRHVSTSAAAGPGSDGRHASPQRHIFCRAGSSKSRALGISPIHRSFFLAHLLPRPPCRFSRATPLTTSFWYSSTKLCMCSESQASMWLGATRGSCVHSWCMYVERTPPAGAAQGTHHSVSARPAPCAWRGH